MSATHQAEWDPVCDAEQERPIALAWRPVFRALAAALADRDYALQRTAVSAELSPDVARQIEQYVADYGETLDVLPEATWESSVASWQGTYWDVLVDLWTIESGLSDLVLTARVFRTGDAYRFVVVGVWVP